MTFQTAKPCKDPYRILNIRREASPYEIARAADLQSRANADGRLSPDSPAAKRLKDIEWAARLLNDPEDRAAYDAASARFSSVTHLDVDPRRLNSMSPTPIAIHEGLSLIMRQVAAGAQKYRR